MLTLTGSRDPLVAITGNLERMLNKDLSAYLGVNSAHVSNASLHSKVSPTLLRALRKKKLIPPAPKRNRIYAELESPRQKELLKALAGANNTTVSGILRDMANSFYISCSVRCITGSCTCSIYDGLIVTAETPLPPYHDTCTCSIAFDPGSVMILGGLLKSGENSRR